VALPGYSLAVNVIQYPAPTGHRCFMLGKAIKKAVDSWEEDLKVVIFGTGGCRIRSRDRGPAS
jgi:protocatechuate 4,5-dioxygenase beta chain